MQVEDIYNIEGRGEIAVVKLEAEDAPLKRGDSILINDVERIITDVEMFRAGVFDNDDERRPIRVGVVLRGIKKS